MAGVDLDRLVRKLDTDLHVALEAAAALASRRGHPTVEVAHWLRALIDIPTTSEALTHYSLDAKELAAELDSALLDMQRGDGSQLTLSQNLVMAVREAWLVASLQFGRSKVRLGDLLIAVNSEPSLRLSVRAMAPSIRDLDVKAVESDLDAAVDVPQQAANSDEQRKSGTKGEEFLPLYTQDMTTDAREGRIDPVIGRDRELRQVIDVLLRRRQNNPILVGEAGVGKTAIAEALALAIASGEVPDMLKPVRLLSLDLSLLQAGAGVKGEFERRLHGVVDEVKKSAKPIILFIDEAHSLIGAGGQAGQGDAANILKPSLARGELRTVAATTWSEYKRYIEKDAALTRRFQTVKIDEPDEETAIRMLRGVAERFKAHHKVRIRDDALAAAVQLSARYIPSRQLPDKAISLIDTAAATVALARQTTPEALQALRIERGQLQTEADRLSSEPHTDTIVARMSDIEARLGEIDADTAELEERFTQEKKIAGEADRLEAVFAPEEFASADADEASNVALFPAHDGGADAARSALKVAERNLADIAGETPLLPRVVDREAIAQLVARWTGIPVGKLLKDQAETVKSLDARLKERVIGQDGAIERIASTMRAARAGLADPRKPPAVFLFVGMSGTGKTETALALADLLYGGSQYLTTINMSEFKEEHKISMLLGSPPGYVGYGEGGVLTEAVRRRPYGVLLLDEIDKAHPGVQEIFYQVFDKGTLRDGEGRDIDFKNTTIVMTANTGSQLLASLAADPDTMPEGDALEQMLLPELQEHFKPAFVGRTAILPFMPLGEKALAGIVDIQIGRIADRVSASYGCELVLSEEARTALVTKAQASELGARAIETMISRELLPVLSTVFLDAVTAKERFTRIEIRHDGTKFDVEATPTTPKEEFADAAQSKRPVNEAIPDASNGRPGAAKPRKAKAKSP